jgi:hypothetical protein
MFYVFELVSFMHYSLYICIIVWLGARERERERVADIKTRTKDELLNNSRMREGAPSRLPLCVICPVILNCAVADCNYTRPEISTGCMEEHQSEL